MRFYHKANVIILNLVINGISLLLALQKLNQKSAQQNAKAATLKVQKVVMKIMGYAYVNLLIRELNVDNAYQVLCLMNHRWNATRYLDVNMKVALKIVMIMVHVIRTHQINKQCVDAIKVSQMMVLKGVENALTQCSHTLVVIKDNGWSYTTNIIAVTLLQRCRPTFTNLT